MNEYLQKIPPNANFIAVTLQFPDEDLLRDLIIRSNVRNNFFINCLIIKGYGSLQINLKEFELHPGNLLIIPPDATKDKIHISNDALIKVVAYTSDYLIPLPLPENFWEMMDYFSAVNIPTWDLNSREVTTIERLIDQMDLYEHNLAGQPFAREIQRYYFMIFIMELAGLSGKYSQPGNHRYSRKELLTINFHSLAKKKFKTQRSVKEYAASLFVTPRYLTETIKEVSGKTAGEVLDSFTIQEAKLQLINSNKRVMEIAEELNFSDQSAFGKFFKRNTGSSPSDFRTSLTS